MDVRAKTAVAIEKALLSGGGQGGSDSVVPKQDYDALQAENNKLKYRVKHLLRALDEKDGGSSSGAQIDSGSMQKMYVTIEGSSSYQMNIVQVLT